MRQALLSILLLTAALACFADDTAPNRQEVPGVRGPLRTRGRFVVDARSRRVKLVGANWYGMEGVDFVPGGLHRSRLPDLMRQVRALGFNHLRLPFSVQMVLENPKVTAHLEANSDLRGKTALEVLDRIVAAAGEAGLGLVLDCHRLAAGWGDMGQEHGLWWSEAWPEARWIAAWSTLARRYRGSATIVGADLFNEPHGRAVWGGDDRATDWRLAAERCGNAILAANPDWLIVVEGTAQAIPGEDHRGYWWGGNLAMAGEKPVRLNLRERLVYSPHEYGPGIGKPPWLSDDAALRRVIGKAWGYLVVQDKPYTTPVYVGEFGVCNGLREGEPPAACFDDAGPFSQSRWFRSLVGVLAEADLDWCYWPLNGTMSSAPDAGRAFGGLDFYGFLSPAWDAPSSRPLADLLDVIRPTRAR